MAQVQFQQVVEMEVLFCANCGIPFAFSQDFKQRRQQDGGSFYCPAGHSNVFRDPEVVRLKKRLEWQELHNKQLESSLEATRNSLRSQKGVNTRLKNRIANGVCPCCNRQFKNLHAHMQTKHPDYKEGAR